MGKLANLVLANGPITKLLCNVLDDLTSWWDTTVRELINEVDKDLFLSNCKALGSFRAGFLHGALCVFESTF
jgi:hypothetical protein